MIAKEKGVKVSDLEQKDPDASTAKATTKKADAKKTTAKKQYVGTINKGFC